MKMYLKYRLRGSKMNGIGSESKQRPGLVLAMFTIRAVPIQRCNTYRVVRTRTATTANKNNLYEVTKMEVRLLSLKDRELCLLYTHLTHELLTLQRIWYRSITCAFFFLLQGHHMFLMDFVVSPPGCGRSATDFCGWDAHEAQLRCPDDVDGDI
jgi:hypothetical protein